MNYEKCDKQYDEKAKKYELSKKEYKDAKKRWRLIRAKELGKVTIISFFWFAFVLFFLTSIAIGSNLNINESKLYFLIDFLALFGFFYCIIETAKMRKALEDNSKENK